MMQTVKFSKKGLIGYITLNRPGSRNAVSSDMIRELTYLIDLLYSDVSLSAVIISGEGKAFCAGADLKEVGKLYGEAKHKFTESAQLMLQKLEKLPKLTIAAINGHAFGGGLELALACDVRILANHAKIGLTETTLGLIPAWGGTQRLPKLTSIGVAKEVILMGQPLDAIEALEKGIVNRICDPSELDDVIEEYVKELKYPEAVESNKRLLLEHWKQDEVARRFTDLLSDLGNSS